MSILEIYDVDVNTKRWTWSRWKLSICYCFDIFLAKIFIIIDALLRFKNFQTTCFNTNTRVQTILLNITTILLVFQDVFKKKRNYYPVYYSVYMFYLVFTHFTFHMNLHMEGHFPFLIDQFLFSLITISPLEF